eukprot:3603894-Rhodomonas_salina.2
MRPSALKLPSPFPPPPFPLLCYTDNPGRVAGQLERVAFIPKKTFAASRHLGAANSTPLGA